MTDKNYHFIEIHDTHGQETHKTLSTAWYRGALGIFLVFDLTSPKTYHNFINSWLDQANEFSTHDCVKVVIGNKNDLSQKREIETEQAMGAAQMEGFSYFETRYFFLFCALLFWLFVLWNSKSLLIEIIDILELDLCRNQKLTISRKMTVIY